MTSDPAGESGVADRVIVVATLALAGAYLYATQQLRVFAFGDPVGPRAFPQLLVAGLVIGAVMLVIEIKARRSVTADAGPREDRRALRVVSGVALLMTAYVALFVPFGYAVATAVFLFVTTSYFHRGRVVANALTSVLFASVTYLVFTRVLGAQLPPGVLPF